MGLVEDEQAAGTKIVEPDAHRRRVGFVDEQTLRDEETGEGVPRIHRVTALAVDCWAMLANVSLFERASLAIVESLAEKSWPSVGVNG